MSAKAAASTAYENEGTTGQRAQPASRERQRTPDLTSAEPRTPNPTTPEDSAAEQNSPTHEQTARWAYEFWMERGCPEGSPDVDWIRAEQELREVSGSASDARFSVE